MPGYVPLTVHVFLGCALQLFGFWLLWHCRCEYHRKGVRSSFVNGDLETAVKCCVNFFLTDSQSFCGAFCQSRFGYCNIVVSTPTATCRPNANTPCNDPSAGGGSTASSSSSTGPSGNDIAGVVVGAIILGIASIILVYCCCCYKTSKEPASG